MTDEELSNLTIGLAIKVHKRLGPGLLESAYKECLFYEIQKSNFPVEKEKPMPLIYDDVKLDVGYRLDLFVDSKLVVETKSVDALNEVHLAQILTYLKLTHCRLGLLINFNVKYLKDGIRRVING